MFLLWAAKHFDAEVGIDVHGYSAPPGTWPTPHIGVVLDPFDYLPVVMSDNPVLKALEKPLSVLESADSALQSGLNLIGEGTRAPEVPPPDVGEPDEDAPEEPEEPAPPIPICLGASVELNGVKRATAGTMGFCSHIPVGVPTPLPLAPGGMQFDNEIFMGSRIVLADTQPFSRFLMPVLSCSIVGAPPPIRPTDLVKKPGKPVPRSLVLPTTAVIAMPSHVEVGGLPTISWMAMAMRGAFAGLGKALKGLGKAYKAVAVRICDKLKIPKGTFRCRILHAEPVDIRDGSVSVEHLDFEIPGRLPLGWVRSYSSSSEYTGVCGHGWETLADLRLELLEDGNVTFCGPNLAALFPHLPTEDTEADDGGTVLDLFDGARLRCEAAHWVVQTKDGMRYRFARGPKASAAPLRPGVLSRIGQIEDACGNYWRFEWRGAQLVRIVESAVERATKVRQGRVIEVKSSAQGLIESMSLVDPATGTPHQLVAYRTARGDLEAAVDAQGAERRFAYVEHRMVRHTDRNGLSFYYDYDNQWRVVHAWGDGGLYDYRFAYNEILHQTEITDSLGNTTVVKLDEDQLPLCEIDPLGGVTVYEYDEAGRTVAVTAPEGLRTSFVYDGYGNLLKTVLPDGSAVSAAFNEGHKPVSMLDPEGGEWSQEWDAQGNLIRQVTPSGAATQYEYNEQGDLLHVTDPAGQRTTLSYDPLGFLAGLTDAMGQGAQFKHDVLGNLLSKQLANGDTTHYRYDIKNRLVESILPDLKRIKCTYDPEDNLMRYRDEAGRETHFTYYCQGSLQSRTDPDGSRVEYHYDTEEQLIGVTNQHGKRWQLKRDGLGRLIEEVDYWGQSRQYGYDAAGYLTRSTDPLGQVLAITCDKLGRIVGKQASETEAETYRYNKRGQLIEAKNQFSKIERKYNEDGQLTEERQRQDSVDADISYLYNPAGQLVEQTQKVQGNRGQTPIGGNRGQTTITLGNCGLSPISFPDFRRIAFRQLSSVFLVLLDVPLPGYGRAHGTVRVLFRDLNFDFFIRDAHQFLDAGIFGGTSRAGVGNPTTG